MIEFIIEELKYNNVLNVSVFFIKEYIEPEWDIFHKFITKSKIKVFEDLCKKNNIIYKFDIKNNQYILEKIKKCRCMK